MGRHVGGSALWWSSDLESFADARDDLIIHDAPQLEQIDCELMPVDRAVPIRVLHTTTATSITCPRNAFEGIW